MKIFFLAQILIFANINAETQKVPVKPKVKMIIELYRHGARWTIFDIFHEKKIQKNQGKLTKVGNMQQLLLGRSVRKAYPEIFNSEYNKKFYRIITSNTERTNKSAIYHNMGLFNQSKKKFDKNTSRYLIPPFAENLSNQAKSSFQQDIFESPKKISKKEVPLIKQNPKLDTLFFANKKITCPMAYQKSKKSKVLTTQKTDIAFQKMAKKLISMGFDPKKMFDKKDFGTFEMGQIFDYYNSYKYSNNGKLPIYNGHQITEELLNELKIIATTSMLNNCFFSNVKLSSHSLSHGISHLIKKKVLDNTFGMKYLGISGHDTDIMKFLIKLDKLNGNCLIRTYKSLISHRKVTDDDYNCIRVLFASNLIWELSEISYYDKKGSNSIKKYLIRLLYNGKPIFNCKNENPAYDGYCTLGEYLRFSEKAFEIEGNFGKECNGDPKFKRSKISNLLNIKDNLMTLVG